ncbi:MAG TPA: hypothetical protein PKO33_11960, partial [Pyrinomonadaceae bacterium]|nr:hypothetical protein [Pyrinomonadaceae bacterium]
MTVISDNDLELGIPGFRFADLFDARRLKDLADEFYDDVRDKDPVLHEALVSYINCRGEGVEKRAASNILTDAAPHLSDFIARLFGIKREREQFQNVILRQNPIWKFKFFVQRRAIKKYPADVVSSLPTSDLTQALKELQFAAFDDTIPFDEELAVATMAARLIEAEEEITKGEALSSQTSATIAKLGEAYKKLDKRTFSKMFEKNVIEAEGAGDIVQVRAALQIFEQWSAIQFHGKTRKWYSFKTPHPLDYQNLVHLKRPDQKLHNIIRGLDKELRRRDGFKLTDDRGTQRDALAEIDYCLICHERDKDSCSTGLREKDGTPKRNPLGIKTDGCPLDEKISEMHLMKRQGDSIASLALVTIDNPMCAGTGHRICND